MNPTLRKQGPDLFQVVLAFPPAAREKWNFKPGLLATEATEAGIAALIANAVRETEKFREHLGRMLVSVEIFIPDACQAESPQPGPAIVVRGERSRAFVVDDFADAMAALLSRAWETAASKVLWIDYPARI